MAMIKLETMPGSSFIAGRYDVFVDDQKRNLARAKTLDDITIPGGAHILLIKSKSGSGKPLSFEIGEDETKVFGIGVAAGPRKARIVGLIAGLSTMLMGLSILVGQGMSFGVMIFLFLVILGLGTYGEATKKSFFTITEL